MSKIQRKLQKNIKKQKEKEKKEYPLKNQILTFAKILFAGLLLAIIICLINNISDGKYKLNEEELVDNKTILAGQTFTRNDEEYYVVFYEESDISDMIDNIVNNKIYKVDLNSGMNKGIVSLESNKEASSAEELKINGTTLIEIEDGKNVSYIEGYEQVKNYLKTLK